MADNVNLTAGDGTLVAAADVIGGVAYQRVKSTIGADGIATDVSAGAGAVGAGVQRMTLASDDPLVALMGTAASFVPHIALDAANDLTDVSQTATAGESSLVAAAGAGKITRLYSYALLVPGAGTMEIRDGAAGTMLRRHVFTAAGGVIRDVRSRPYAVGTANTAMIFYWSGSGAAQIDAEYTNS